MGTRMSTSTGSADREQLLPPSAPIPANPAAYQHPQHPTEEQDEWQEVTKILSLLSALLLMLFAIVLLAHQVHRHHHGAFDPDQVDGEMVGEMWKGHVEDIFSRNATRVLAPKRTRTINVVELM